MVPMPAEAAGDANFACLTTAWRFLPVYIKTAILALLDVAVATSEIPPSDDTHSGLKSGWDCHQQPKVVYETDPPVTGT